MFEPSDESRSKRTVVTSKVWACASTPSLTSGVSIDQQQRRHHVTTHDRRVQRGKDSCCCSGMESTATSQQFSKWRGCFRSNNNRKTGENARLMRAIECFIIKRRPNLRMWLCAICVALSGHESLAAQNKLSRIGASNEVVSINNLVPRRDVAGRILDAHDGSLEHFGTRFCLYGTHYGRTNGLRKTNFYVCYSSSDLVHWKLEGRLLLDRSLRTYYRPYVKYNKTSKQYVLWYNADDQYGVAVATRPEGPFRIVNPDVRMKYSAGGVGDFGFFVDADRTGYITYVANVTGARESTAVVDPRHHQISIEKLAPDYLSSTEENSGFVAGNVEAPSLFLRQGNYYLLFDNTCAFCPNGSGVRVYTSDRPMGPYTFQSNINVRTGLGDAGRSWTIPGTGRSDDILHAQQTDIAELPTTSGTLYMWMGDRWGSTPDGAKGHDFQVWVPLRFDGRNVLSLEVISCWNVTLSSLTAAELKEEGRGGSGKLNRGISGGSVDARP